ncbi:NADH-quinone oxidoreductase subunit NuoF [Thiorhodospira sibirica]|uniref:NADH-quinone oxidoreductase subunit NuoF n=1 Tax=Thiorhodospira sibirica TaxID=154347 RepID=UPI00022C0B0D|nr:NADH-quinone oxidoreductase subunit NuoF [Thiorhodospira sibirica]
MPGRKILTDFPLTPTAHHLDDYRARGGYETLAKALHSLRPEDIIQEVVDAGIQGRGGAAFPAGRKWQVVNPHDGQPHYLVANADEGEPGTFKDRWVLEYAPHQLLESMLLCAYGLGVRHCFIYIRGEYDRPLQRIQTAVEEAYAAGYFGEQILGSTFSCDVVIFRGAGSYVCGEASALLNSLEGKRGYPRNRPPRLTVQGLWQRPTVVNNTETLANIAWIIRHGGAAYRAIGTEKSPGTRLISISGHVAKPGVYEVEMGYPFKTFLEQDCGGVAGGRALKAVIPGGTSSPILPPDIIEGLSLDHESFWDVDSGLGSGGMIIIAEGTCMVRALAVMLRFYHHESCGQCTPCREGVGWMHRIIQRILHGQGTNEDLERLEYIAKFNTGTTICGLGDAAGAATIGILKHFRHEFDHFISHKRSLCDGRLELRCAS